MQEHIPIQEQTPPVINRIVANQALSDELKHLAPGASGFFLYKPSLDL